MNRQLASLMIAAGALGFCIPAQAQTLFSDNFDLNFPGLNRTPTGWTKGNSGKVDITGTCGSSSLFDLLPGNGCYIDLDGSTRSPGLLTRSFNLFAGTTYGLDFDLAGSQRGSSEVVDVIFGDALKQFTVASDEGFSSRSLAFTPSSDGVYSISFLNQGGDNVGALLDNVTIRSAPVSDVPGPLPILGAGAAWSFSRKLKRQLAERRGITLKK
jgi:hypothetical protein